MRRSIGQVIGGGFGISLVILIVLGVVSFSDTRRLVETADNVSVSHELIERLQALLQDLTDAETGQRGYVITGEESYLEPYTNALSSIAKDTDALSKLTADNPEQQQDFARIAPLVRQKLDELQQTIGLRKNQGFEAAQVVVVGGAGKNTMDQVRVIETQMTDRARAILLQRDLRARAGSRTTVDFILFGVPLALVLTAIVAVLITRSIARPLGELTRIATSIAEGDLSLKVADYRRRDEIGTLAMAFRRMSTSLAGMADLASKIAAGDLSAETRPQSDRDSLGVALSGMVGGLRRMTGEIREVTGLLASSVAEILASTRQMAVGAAETATAVSETTTTVEEVKQTAQVSSQKARYVSETALRAVQVSKTGQETVVESIEGMGHVKEHVRFISDGIAALSAHSQAIGEIIASVNDLAEQTNLLAVNAAIEAAKAGEQGRGFAVVAQEVRSLASQSKQATAQVRSILGEIQRATGSAVMAAEQGSKAVEAGVKQSGEAGVAIRTLSDNIAESAQAATQIAASSQQELVGMDQVVRAMENIRVASAQNAASTAQAETAAKDLHELGQRLKSLVERYRL